MKKIYFACSIAGGRDQAQIYPVLINFIKDMGGHVLTELFAEQSLKSEVGTNPSLTPHFVWRRDLDWIREADAVIAEVTQPSLGTGYEIAKAHEWGKPVLALYHPQAGRRLSPMILGSPEVQVAEYSDIKEAQSAIADFMNSTL